MKRTRKDINPNRAKSLARNRELRDVIMHLTANPKTSIQQLAKAFNWSVAKGRNAVDHLVNAELVYMSKKELTIYKSPIFMYSVCEHTEDELDIELPIQIPEAEAKKVKRNEYGGWIPGQIRRDPLDLALMGTGIAPSILFHRSEDASIQA